MRHQGSCRRYNHYVLLVAGIVVVGRKPYGEQQAAVTRGPSRLSTCWVYHPHNSNIVCNPGNCGNSGYLGYCFSLPSLLHTFSSSFFKISVQTVLKIPADSASFVCLSSWFSFAILSVVVVHLYTTCLTVVLNIVFQCISPAVQYILIIIIVLFMCIISISCFVQIRMNTDCRCLS